MKPPAWRSLALSSAICFAAVVHGAMRPRYGGELRMQLQSVDIAEASISRLVFETLVAIDDNGEPRPFLAASFWRDSRNKRWHCALRERVLFHDGTPLTAAQVAASLSASLKADYPDVAITVAGHAVVLNSERPMPNLLSELSLPRHAIARRIPGRLPLGTGPFRVAEFSAGSKLTLQAFEDYWGGRPFVDTVNVSSNLRQMAVPPNSADVWELPVIPTRRLLPDKLRVWTSAPRELIACVFSSEDGRLREALALSIDRNAIAGVLTQKNGVAASSLLPDWLSGYAFLFPAALDAPQARTIASTLPQRSMGLRYTLDDPLLRSIAERIAVNARDAGITIKLQTGNADATVARLPIASTDAAVAILEMARTLGVSLNDHQPNLARPETLYEAELALMERARLIPLVHLPSIYGIGPRVHDWNSAHRKRTGELHLEDVWISP